MRFDRKYSEKVKERGDKYTYLFTYEKGDKTIDNGTIMTWAKYMRIKCPYCGTEYDVDKHMFFRDNRNCIHCCHKYENSFAYYIQQTLHESLDKYWDWEKNIVNPYLIYKHTTKYTIWIKCTKTDYHKSYLTTSSSFVADNRCPYCSHASGKIHPRDSFAQYHIDNTDEDFLKKYWSDKNTLDPWKLAPYSNEKVWIKCVNEEINLVNGMKKMDYHSDYLVGCDRFSIGNRCPYCLQKNGTKVHKYDSFGTFYPEMVKYWDFKLNDTSPYAITPYGNKKYWFKCEKCGEPFERILYNLSKPNCGVVCTSCRISKGEYKLKNYLCSLNWIKGVDYISQKKFKDLVGLGGGQLSYDFYLPKHNLLIEYQGEFHDGTSERYDGQYKKQIEHDRLKFNYAMENNIDIIYVNYWQFNEIEEIMRYELQIS